MDANNQKTLIQSVLKKKLFRRNRWLMLIFISNGAHVHTHCDPVFLVGSKLSPLLMSITLAWCSTFCNGWLLFSRRKANLVHIKKKRTYCVLQHRKKNAWGLYIEDKAVFVYNTGTSCYFRKIVGDENKSLHMTTWFILIKCLVHGHARHDQLIFFSVPVNHRFGIYHQLRFSLEERNLVMWPQLMGTWV